MTAVHQMTPRPGGHRPPLQNPPSTPPCLIPAWSIAATIWNPSSSCPTHCVDLIYIDTPFNCNRNYEVFWGETKEKRAFEDRHENTKAYIDYMRRVLKRPAA